MTLGEECMSNIEKYKKYFTKEYLMGPNSFRLLDELIMLEGLPGTGKSTNAYKLYEQMIRNGRKPTRSMKRRVMKGS